MAETLQVLDPVTLAPAAPGASTESFTQAQMDVYGDQRANQAAETVRKSEAEKHKAELEKAEKKAEVAKLAEDGKHQEIAESYKAELDSIRAEKSAAELKAATAELLTEKKLGDVSGFFDGDLNTIEGRTAAVDVIAKYVAGLVDSGVNDRLTTPSPLAPSPTPAAGDLNSQIAEAERKGDFGTSMRLKDIVMEDLHKQKG